MDEAAPPTFRQSPDIIRDFVFPLAVAEGRGIERPVKRILGTAFLIGDRGFALTARHVFSGCDNDPVIGVFLTPAGDMVGVDIASKELHPTEDVAIVKLGGEGWKSFFRLINSYENSSCKYSLWAYPDDTYYEVVADNMAILRPDLVYNEGYVRRRISREIPSLSGTSFFELSQVAGDGASGSPVVRTTRSLFVVANPAWDVIGIYVGQRTNDRATSVSYAVRADAFWAWVPEILGKSVLEESQQIGPFGR
jgi:hypothetical protein